MYSAHGALMDGNQLMNNEQTHVQRNSHPLKFCDKCKLTTEPMGGVAVRDKWYCGACWIKFLKG
jgi:hypothetical protein